MFFRPLRDHSAFSARFFKALPGRAPAPSVVRPRMPSSWHLWLRACFHLTSGDGCTTTDARSYGTHDALCSGTANERTLENSRLAHGLQLHELAESHQYHGCLRSPDQTTVRHF